jgi:hypothetical protein
MRLYIKLLSLCRWKKRIACVDNLYTMFDRSLYENPLKLMLQLKDTFQPHRPLCFSVSGQEKTSLILLLNAILLLYSGSSFLTILALTFGQLPCWWNNLLALTLVATLSVFIYHAFWVQLKSNFIKFDQIYGKNYQYLNHNISTNKNFIRCIFVWYKFGIINIDIFG